MWGELNGWGGVGVESKHFEFNLHSKGTRFPKGSELLIYVKI